MCVIMIIIHDSALIMLMSMIAALISPSFLSILFSPSFPMIRSSSFHLLVFFTILIALLALSSHDVESRLTSRARMAPRASFTKRVVQEEVSSHRVISHVEYNADHEVSTRIEKDKHARYRTMANDNSEYEMYDDLYIAYSLSFSRALALSWSSL